ncbi:MAG: InlB B-repeat-containing protein [Lachnospiraceae bacterium]|nr:InlB B-repeat-containing protein [Lachnospiraceae bacterium]
MKAKEYIIQKLVNVGKKHRWMKYPMLALVSLISLFFLVIEKCMKQPKRAVIALACIVLIVTQSWYLISLANDAEPTDPAATGTTVSDGTSVDGTGSEEAVSPSGVVDVPNVGDAGESSAVYTLNYNGGVFGTNTTVTLNETDLSGAGYALDMSMASNHECYELAGWSYSGGSELITENLTVDDFAGNKNITVYAVWQLCKYRVTFDPGEGEGEITSPQLVDIVDGVAPTITLSNQAFTRTGYTFSTWMINDNPTDLCAVGSDYVIQGTTPDIIVRPKWDPITYYIEFNSNDPLASGTMENLAVKYDEQVPLTPNAFTKTGYSFANWVGENDLTYDNAAVVSNLSATHGDVFTMNAQWAYQIARPSKTEVTYAYDNSVLDIIDIYHNEVGDGEFLPTLAAVSGETMDGTVTVDNYSELTGLTITPETNKITISSDAIKTIGDIRLSFIVTDVRNTSEPTTTIDIVVHLGQKTLTVIGVDNKTKMYDGTAEIPVGSIWYTDGTLTNNSTQTEIPGITVNNTSQKGTFVGGETAAQAGEGKTILLENIYLSGENAKYYTIAPTAEITGGSITKRQVRVTTAPVYEEGKDHILTGQSPKFTVIVEPSDLPETVAAEDELIIKNAIDNGVRNYYICDYGAPDYLAGSNYTINIDVDNVELNNYYLQVTTGKLVVKQENPIEVTDYSIIGDLSEDNVWYYGSEPRVETTSTSNYNCVYIMSSSDKKAVTYESGLFTNSFVITEELARGEMYVQLANSDTKAVTNVAKLNIKVDVTAPTIDVDGIKIETVNTTGLQKFGNFLSFGNFFKEELKITVPVADLRSDGSVPNVGEVSGAKSITYYLGGLLGGEGKEAKVENGVAVFNVPMNFKGEIAFTTVDNAGNVSNHADLIGVEDSGYWVIENTAPELVVTAVDNEGNTAFAGEGNYYKTVKVSADVSDNDAGIAYVLWTITKNGEVIAENEKELVTDTTKQVFTHTFTKKFTESGVYTVAVVAYDNADNVSMEQAPIEFVVDGTPPVVTISPEDYDALWSNSKTITFTVTDTESGVDLLTLKNEDGGNHTYSVVEGETDTYTFTVTKKGTYTIKVVDNAGNAIDVPVTFTKVSNEVPENPVVTISPAIPEEVEDTSNYWYAENPTITITAPSTTPDGTEVITYYHMWKAGTDEPTYDNYRAGAPFQLQDEGIWNLRVWSETEAGVKNEYASEEDGLYQIRYDDAAPVITDVLLTGSGTTSKISFTVTEPTSGLAKLEAVFNGNEENAQPLLFEAKGDGTYTASFTASMKGSYSVKATDLAGNVGRADAFEPMGITVSSITGSTEKGITVMGQVTAGTFEIDNVAANYGLESGDITIEADDLIVTTDDEGNKAFTAKFTQLDPNTRYRFRITAMSTNGESCNYTGAFKTAVEGEVGINVAGTVIDETMEPDDETEISVMLYDGSAVVQSRNVKNGESFIFTNVPNGMYTIRAVNGNRMVSQGVVISNNKVIEPTDAIQLILKDGQVTDVVYEDSTTPQFIISGLDNIFDDSTNFGGLQDNAVIDAGGAVEFRMTVNGLSESEVPENDLARIQHNMRSNETVAMYVDFSIWKRVYGAYGLISETPVTSIAGGKTVRIVIPMSQELAAKDGLSVIRVHDGTVERLVDLDINPNTYTIESALYSTYALVYTDETKNTATDNPGSSTSDNGGNGNNNNNNGGNNGGTNGNGGNNSNGGTNGGSASTSDISVKPNANGTLTQSGGYTPKTGDATPIIWVGAVMVIMAGAGVMLLKNKKR